MKTVLLTGSTGFVGGHVKKSLVDDNFEVVEFNGDITKLENWVNNLHTLPEAIIHCAGVRSESKKDFDINVGGVKALLIALANTSKKPNTLIFISTQAVYFGLKPPFSEGAAVNPATSYGKSKFQAEEIVTKIGTKFGIRTVSLRLSTVLGPGVREKNKMSGPLFAWTQKVLVNEPIEVFQDGKQTRDYIAVSDVVSAIMLTLKNNKMEGIFNIGGGKKIKLVELAKWIKKAAGSNSKILIIGGEPSQSDPKEMFSGIKKIRSHGWKPKKTAKNSVYEFIASRRYRPS